MEEEALLIIGIISIVLFAVVQVLYLMTTQNVLKAVRPEFQKIPPGQVWLGMIPIFNFIWSIIINPKIAASIREDLEDRGHSEGGDYGKQIGVMYPAFRLGAMIPFIGILFGLGGLVIWIVFWVKMGNYKTLLQSLGTNSNDQLLDN